MRNEAVIVVKIGGSLAGGADIDGWLDTLSACAGRVVVVPGGGPFADAVRNAQARIGFDDLAAHHMALLAMEQFGRALVSLRPGFALADSVSAIAGALDMGRVPVWAPLSMAARAPDVPPSWDVTSDSLAAWLAGTLRARRLLMIKHAVPPVPAQARDLVDRGIVDPAFPQFLDACGADAAIISAHEHAAARAILYGGGLPGVRILRADHLASTP